MHIENFLSTKIGHRLDIDGRFILQVRGETRLLAEAVTLTSESWQGDAQLLSVGNLSVSVDSWSLISGPTVVNDLKIESVDLNIEYDADGHANWATGATAERADSRGEVDTGFIAF